MSGQWDERSRLVDFRKNSLLLKKKTKKEIFFLFFYTLSYLDMLGYCVSLLNTVRIKPPLLEQKDRIWVVDGILGQQSFNIVMYNKFSNYLRQFELSFYFFQPNSQPHQWTTFIPASYIILYVPHFQLPLAENLSFPPDSKPLWGPRGHSALCLFRTRAWYRAGYKACEEWLFTSQSFQKVVKFLSILLYIIT